jgi:hypothetical protein
MGRSASARRVQHLVQVSRSAVLDLVKQRDDDLRALATASHTAAAQLRAATVRVVTALGVMRVATVLGVHPAVVRALCSPEQPISCSTLRRRSNEPGLTTREALSAPQHPDIASEAPISRES